MFEEKVLKELQELRRLIGHLIRKVGFMQQEVENIIKQFDDATNNLANEINDLKSRVGTGMSTEDVEQLKTELQAKVDRLKALGADSSNPVPAA